MSSVRVKDSVDVLWLGGLG